MRPTAPAARPVGVVALLVGVVCAFSYLFSCFILFCVLFFFVGVGGGGGCVYACVFVCGRMCECMFVNRFISSISSVKHTDVALLAEQ